MAHLDPKIDASTNNEMRQNVNINGQSVDSTTDLSDQKISSLHKRYFEIIQINAPAYSHIVVEDDVNINHVLSFALSHALRVNTRTSSSNRQYLSAFTSTFQSGFAQNPDLFTQLLTGVESAKVALRRVLLQLGFAVKGGSKGQAYRVQFNSPSAKNSKVSSVSSSTTDGTSGSALLRRAHLAFILLSDVYDALIAHGKWHHSNPLYNENTDEDLDTDARGHYGQSNRTFIFGHQYTEYVAPNDKFYGDEILSIADSFPQGLRIVTKILVETGARISEPLALDLSDWAINGFGTTIRCPNKGSRGARVKTLYISSALRDELWQYVGEERAMLSGHSAFDIQRVSQLGARSKAWSDLRKPLLLAPNGNRIGDSNFRDHYWRPRMTAAGLPALTPHILRHEHARRALQTIYTHKLTKDQPEYWIEAYALLQGWLSGARMAEYYAGEISRHKEIQIASIIASGPTSELALLDRGSGVEDTDLRMALQLQTLDILKEQE